MNSTGGVPLKINPGIVSKINSIEVSSYLFIQEALFILIGILLEKILILLREWRCTIKNFNSFSPYTFQGVQISNKGKANVQLFGLLSL